MHVRWGPSIGVENLRLTGRADTLISLKNYVQKPNVRDHQMVKTILYGGEDKAREKSLARFYLSLDSRNGKVSIALMYATGVVHALHHRRMAIRHVIGFSEGRWHI